MLDLLMAAESGQASREALFGMLEQAARTECKWIVRHDSTGVLSATFLAIVLFCESKRDNALSVAAASFEGLFQAAKPLRLRIQLTARAVDRITVSATEQPGTRMLCSVLGLIQSGYGAALADILGARSDGRLNGETQLSRWTEVSALEEWMLSELREQLVDIAGSYDSAVAARMRLERLQRQFNPRLEVPTAEGRVEIFEIPSTAPK